MIDFLNGQNLWAFAEQGGAIIIALFILACVLWSLIIERLYFFKFIYPKRKNEVIQQWQLRSEKRSWAALSIRQLVLSQQQLALARFLSLIKVLIALCPLLGLLGTVTGMIAVFDTIAITGNSDAKAMAEGIFQATLPTMSGLVLAISALYFSHYLQERFRLHCALLNDALDMQCHKAAYRS